MNSIKNIAQRIIREYDTFEEKYYKHKYGLESEEITGRNFNIGVRKKGTSTFLDIGNIIVMENKKMQLAVELALGNCTISMSYFGTNSTVSGSRISDVFEVNTIEKTKFADALIVVAVLLFEGINNIKSHRWFEYNFRKYCKAIFYWKEKLNVNYERIAEYIRNFLIFEYNSNITLSNKEIIYYISKGDSTN